MEGRSGTAKLYYDCQCLESSNCKEVWLWYWNLTSATKFIEISLTLGSTTHSLSISLFVVIISPNNETTTDTSEEFKNS